MVKYIGKLARPAKKIPSGYTGRFKTDLQFFASSNKTTFTSKKLQHEFSHADDFGITENWNKANGEAYQKAIENHINTFTDVYQSTYRGQDVNVYINRNTGIGAYTDLSGNYIGGWKFSAEQMNFHLSNGIKIR